MTKEGITFYTTPKGYGKTYYELEKLRKDNQHLLDLQKSMDKQYEELENENKQLKEILHNINVSDGVTTTPVLDLIKENQQLKEQIRILTEHPFISKLNKSIKIDKVKEGENNE